MCAISGLLTTDGSAVDLATLERISATMRRRGPDDHLAMSFGRCGLGHERLSIVDVEGGRQPLLSEDGQVAAVVNGEIYNHEQLRTELSAAGHVFTTRSDSEVVVHGYEAFGTAIFEKLHGMFAIAIWDGREQTLVLARDGLGKKPLAYTWIDSSTFAFASDVRALHAHPRFRPTLSIDAIGQYLGYRCVADPGSIYTDVHKVPAGEWLAVRPDGTTRHGAHWRLPRNESVIEYDPKREPELAERLRQHVSEAVKRRLMSDVPVGVLLSGGIDSTIIAYEAARHGGRVKSFTLGFLGIEDECEVARRTAQALDTNHSELRIEFDPRGAMEDAEAAYDEPFADSSSVASVRLCRAAREHVGVVLNGDGGDEAFAGYPRARLLAESWDRRMNPLSALAQKAQAKLGSRTARTWAKDTIRIVSARERYTDDFERWRAMLWIFSPDEVSRMTGKDVVGQCRGSPVTFADTEADDYEFYLRNDLLVKMDRASMHVGLEARSPLLDTDVIRFVRGLAPGWKLRGSETKYLLRRAYAGLLPPHVWNLRKRGFASPTRKWLATTLKSDVSALAQDRSQPLYRVLDYREVQAVTAGFAADHKKIWTLLTLNRWLARNAALLGS